MNLQTKNPLARRLAFAAVLPFAAVSFVGCAEDTVVQEAEEAGPSAEAAILGETVTLQNEVQDIVGPGVFTVGENDTIILGTDVSAGIEDGDMVQVTGTVRNLIVADLEEEGYVFDEDESSYVVEYEQGLVVEADAVEVIPE